MPTPAAPPRRTPPLLAAVLLAVSLAYPVVVYLALGHVSPRWIALLLVGLALARAWVTRESFWLGAAALAIVLAAASFLGGLWGPLKLYPALVNAVMFGLFAMSLWRGPSVVERLARLREPDFPPAAVAYTRRVTQVWCGFFVVNGLVAVATALWASTAAWTLYNGLLSYVAMGALMGGEWLVRQRVRARIAARDAVHERPGASNA
ncbi:MAG: hypothetical protein JF586_13075 [Burkholderiales bacterium]|nr:hypothetical protein [Burkholderiales bacterium]